MHEIVNLKEKLCRELEEYARRDRLDYQSVQIIDTIAHTVKNLNKIIDDYNKNGYSEAPRMRVSYSNGYNYGHGDRDWRNANYYSMNDRYSTSNNMLVDRLRNIMMDTPDERSRMEIQRLIDRMA